MNMKFSGVIGADGNTKVTISETPDGQGYRVYIDDVMIPNVRNYRLELSAGLPTFVLEIVPSEFEDITNRKIEVR